MHRLHLPQLHKLLSIGLPAATSKYQRIARTEGESSVDSTVALHGFTMGGAMWGPAASGETVISRSWKAIEAQTARSSPIVLEVTAKNAVKDTGITPELLQLKYGAVRTN